jgi:hypothetical protein
MKGFRQQVQSGRKERLREIEAELKNMQMALRINQMMVQQLLQNSRTIGEDLGRALNLINELQYKNLAMQQMGSFDLTALQQAVDSLRLKDFNDASDKEDKDGNFTEGDLVTEDSTVIITSTTDDPNDAGIFRSRVRVSEAGNPDFVKAFMGRPVGAKAVLKLNGKDHTIELLAVRQPPKQEASVASSTEELKSTAAEASA